MVCEDLFERAVYPVTYSDGKEGFDTLKAWTCDFQIKAGREPGEVHFSRPEDRRRIELNFLVSTIAVPPASAGTSNAADTVFTAAPPNIDL